MILDNLPSSKAKITKKINIGIFVFKKKYYFNLQ